MGEPIARGGYHHGDLARAALNAAVAIIDREGSEAVSMRAIAAELGVTHRALYRYYGDRDALLSACAAAGYRALLERVAPSTDLRGYSEAYLQFALARPHLYATMLRAHVGARSEELERAVGAVIGRARTAIGDDRAVQRAWTILHGGLSLHAAGALRARDGDALVAFLLTLVEEE